MPSVSVVICAYTERRQRDLARAIASVRDQEKPAREIVTVIDHNPELHGRVQDENPDIRVVENAGELGLSGARNSGIAASCGDVVAFMDDDAVAAPDWLARLSEHYQDPDVMGAGGRIVPCWPKERPRWLPAEFDWVVGCTYLGMPEQSAPVRNLIGCNMSFRREIFETIGGFRSEVGRVGVLPAGCEETELCIRARQRWPERELRYDPAARVYHSLPPDRMRWDYFRSRCYHEGRSKAIISAWVGQKDGLATERAYTLNTLPAGIARGLGEAVQRGAVAGLLRAGVIIAGLSFTAVGYFTERLRSRVAVDRSKPKEDAHRGAVPG